MKRKLLISSVGVLLTLLLAMTCVFYVYAENRDEIADNRDAIARSPEEKLITYETDARLFLTADAAGCGSAEELAALLEASGAAKVTVLNEDMVTAVCKDAVLETLAGNNICPVEEKELNFETAPILFRLEDYPQFDTIEQLYAYVKDVMGVDEAVIMNDAFLWCRE